MAKATRSCGKLPDMGGKMPQARLKRCRIGVSDIAVAEM